MGTPQIVMIVLYAISIGITMQKHGKPKEGTESLWLSLFAVGINVAILYWGGFF